MNLTGRPVYQKPTLADRLLDKKFQAWVKKQPSAISGRTPCDPAHYNTAANAGKATKALFSCVPLTREEHRLQHDKGTFSLRPREWWEEQTAEYFHRFMEEYCDRA